MRTRILPIHQYTIGEVLRLAGVKNGVSGVLNKAMRRRRNR
jgi:hypothetical protein